MIGYFLSPTQIEWVKNNVNRFSEKVPFDADSILVIDNQGGIMRQVTMYIEADENFDGDIYIVRYSITSMGSAWDDEGSLPRRRNAFEQGALSNERTDRIELVKPTTLHDGDKKFEELKQLISHC